MRTKTVALIAVGATSHPPNQSRPRGSLVTCPKEGIPSSQSSNFPESHRKCPGVGAGLSGQAVCAFVPLAAGLPRRRDSQYVSPGPPALPPPSPCLPRPSLLGPVLAAPWVSGGTWEKACPPHTLSGGGFQGRKGEGKKISGLSKGLGPTSETDRTPTPVI